VKERNPSAQELAASMRAGICPDDISFDRFLPIELQLVSREHWTPLCVAMRVAGWLDELGIRSVVDLGSGSGKFCVATALASRCEFIGVEQRPRLIDAAEDLARAFGVEDRLRFVEGTLGEALIPEADAYYLFNPFGENVIASCAQLDDDIKRSDERYRRDVARMESFLEDLPVGAYVIKYNGFGGNVPVTYKPIRVDREMPCVLRVWRKTWTR
jgi:SAM-dependent methyltransferase